MRYTICRVGSIYNDFAQDIFTGFADSCRFIFLGGFYKDTVLDVSSCCVIVGRAQDRFLGKFIGRRRFHIDDHRRD